MIPRNLGNPNRRNQQGNQKRGKNRNKKGNPKKEGDRENLREVENALLDQIFIIINQVMEVIQTNVIDNNSNNQGNGVNRSNRSGSRNNKYDDNPTYQRLYGDRDYHPNRLDERGISKERSEMTDTMGSRNQTSNVTMNIERPSNLRDLSDQQNNVVMPGGAQLYPGQQYRQSNIQRVGQNNRQGPRQNYPQVQNRYQPTRGPGGRLEAPRDNVVIGAQALQYARSVANRVGSQNISMNSTRNAQPVRATGGPGVANIGRRRPVSRAPVPVSRPAAAPAAPRAAPVAARPAPSAAVAQAA